MTLRDWNLIRFRFWGFFFLPAYDMMHAEDITDLYNLEGKNMKMKRTVSLLLILILLAANTCGIAEGADRIINIDLSTASDEELADAAKLIRDEQKARLKTTIQLDPVELTVNKGKSARVVPTLQDIPEDVKAGKFTWSSSDETVAVCSNGTVKGVGPGTAMITCTNILSDETEVTADLPVTCVVPVQGVAPALRSMEVMSGDDFTIDVVIKPEDATNKEVTFSSSDETIVKVGENGQLTAGLPGTANITITSADGTNKSAKLGVKVVKRIGKFDDEITFQELEWGMSDTEVYNTLVDSGLLSKDSNDSSYFTPFFYHWPEDDVFFSHYESFRSVPVILDDNDVGTTYIYATLLKKIGGYTPNETQFLFLNPIAPDGSVDTGTTELNGVYIRFDNEHEPGTEIFTNLLAKMEAQYGEFTRYISKGMTGRSGRDIYPAIKNMMEGAKVYNYRDYRKEKGKDFYLYDCAICTLHGKNNTGLMIMLDTLGYVTVYYGKTDTVERLAELQAALEAVPNDTEDAGI